MSYRSYSSFFSHSSGHGTAISVLGLYDLHCELKKNYALDGFYSYLNCPLSYQ